ncbi:MAG TPA: TolC family protein [Caulobacteraceae bacterium]
MQPGKVVGGALSCGLALWLCACIGYSPRPLASGPALASDVSRLGVDVSRLRLRALKAHRFDPADGLDPTEVAVLAVLNSPDLAAKRAASKVAAAQAFSAGLLPDPQIALSADFPVNPKGLVTAYGITPTIDLMALVTRSTALTAARASEKQVDLDLLWSEWSIAQQARQLAVTALGDEAKSAVLKVIDDGLTRRYRQSSLAYQRHDETAQVNSVDLAAKLDADAQLALALHDALKARGDLNALIGLAPGVRLDLVAGAPPVHLQPSELDAALVSLPLRRPDLLALRAGYEAQSANLRKAIISQFPLINLGFSRQRDTGAILTNGVAATVVIPIFNRGRGVIAVQSASREQLAREYQARLDQTVADVAIARRDLAADQVNLARLEPDVPRLVSMTDSAEAAYLRGDLDSAASLALEESSLREQAALLDLRLALALADISLETVLFLPSDESARP